MSNEVIIHKGRTNQIVVNMGYDVSADTITSEIRSEPTTEAPLIATWTVAFVTTGVDGKLLLTLDNTVTKDITAVRGYMDLKRMHLGEPLPVFDTPLEVTFRGTVTV
jgi:hypothetical protein